LASHKKIVAKNDSCPESCDQLFILKYSALQGHMPYPVLLLFNWLLQYAYNLKLENYKK